MKISFVPVGLQRRVTALLVTWTGGCGAGLGALGTDWGEQRGVAGLSEPGAAQQGGCVQVELNAKTFGDPNYYL